jgi:hypothetical protein
MTFLCLACLLDQLPRHIHSQALMSCSNFIHTFCVSHCRKGNATVTAYCLGLLVDALARLRQSEHEQRLLPQVSNRLWQRFWGVLARCISMSRLIYDTTHADVQELAMMRAVETEMMKLLCICFENYYSLDEQANFGMLDGGRVAMETPAPAMRPAVELTGAEPLHTILLAKFVLMIH